MTIKDRESFLSIIVAGLLTLLYLCFPSINNTIDSLSYAAEVKWNTDLFKPHHLLYNFSAYGILQICYSVGFIPSVLKFMIALNAVAAGLCLVIFSQLLKELNVPDRPVWLLLVGSSFGFMRFATENETYIFPILFSLLGTFYFIKSINTKLNKYLFFSGLFSAFACLFHQIHFFWWLALLVGTIMMQKKIWKTILFIFPAVVVPFGYFWVYTVEKGNQFEIINFWKFVFEAFYNGETKAEFGFPNLYLSFINLFRTFFQVHGNIWFFMKYNRWFFLPLVIILVSGILVLLKLKRSYVLIKKEKTPFLKVFILIAILQFLFAFYALGNAEFMVMLPIMIVLIITGVFYIRRRLILLISFIMLIWNFFYAILPYSSYKFSRTDYYEALVTNHSSDLFVLNEDNLIKNQVFYDYGIEDPGNIEKTPANSAMKLRNADYLKRRIHQYLVNGKQVYTDCIGTAEILNRHSMLSGNENEAFFNKYLLVPVDTIHSFYGVSTLHEVKLKHQ